MTTHRFFAIAMTAALSATTLSAPALADVPTKAVSYADLDLASASGRATLNQRIERALKDVCAPLRDQNAAGFAAGQAEYRNCMTAGNASVRQQIAAMHPMDRLASR